MVRKERTTEPASGDKKLTMYDLIYDTMSSRFVLYFIQGGDSVL